MTFDEKMRVIGESSHSARSFTVGGKRYAKCRLCGKLWNISKTLRIRGTGYQCPKCFYSGRNKDAVQG